MSKQTTVLIITLFAVALIFSVYAFVRQVNIYSYGCKRFEQEQLPENVEVITGAINIPTTKIEIESSVEFAAKIVELDSTTIYKTSSPYDNVYFHYYVFTDNNQTAYHFHPVFSELTGKMVN